MPKRSGPAARSRSATRSRAWSQLTRRNPRAHRIDLQQVQPRRAQMHARDRPVVKAGDAERAPVAHTLAENAPRVPKVAAVLPDGPGDLGVVIGLRLACAVGLES